MNTEMPSTTRWREITRLFDAAVDLDPAARARYLDEACGGDEHLHRRLDSLLAADARVHEILHDLDILSAGEGTPTGPGFTGNLVGSYRLLEELGHGGTGIVYKARDRRLGRLAALKFLVGYPAGEAKKRLLREARAAAALDHTNICTVYEVGETADRRVFLAMAYSDGETLKQRVARGPLAVDEAVRLAAQVGRALLAAHRQGVIHRDLKPANVLITTCGVAKLCDFGIAHLPGDESGSASQRGTPAYTAPERIRGNPADVRSDLWSLGVILYEMLTGEQPFRSEGCLDLLRRILQDSPTPVTKVRPEVPAALGRVVTKLLAKEPAHRYASAELLLAELLAFAGPPGSQATPATGLREVVVAVASLLLAALGWVGSRFALRGRARSRTFAATRVPSSGRRRELRRGLIGELLARRKP